MSMLKHPSLFVRAGVLGLVAAVVVTGPSRAHAQPPGTDIYLAPLATGKIVEIGEPVNVTKRSGYDNQPHFARDGLYFLYASIDTSGQADVYRYHIGEGRHERVTNTPESEYSPTLLPGTSGFSSVRVEADGTTQRLWRFDTDGGNPRLLMTDVDSVGYHAWVGDETLVLFIVGEPHTLRVVDVPSQGEAIVARDIGVSLLGNSGTQRVSFTQLVGEVMRVRFLDVPERGITDGPMLPVGAVHCAWAPDGTLLCSSESTVYWYDGESWRPAADLAAYDVAGVSRMAVAPDGRSIAIVAADAQ